MVGLLYYTRACLQAELNTLCFKSLVYIVGACIMIFEYSIHFPFTLNPYSLPQEPRRYLYIIAFPSPD
jgi:uncharacterized membrane protein (DUF106 family)